MPPLAPGMPDEGIDPVPSAPGSPGLPPGIPGTPPAPGKPGIGLPIGTLWPATDTFTSMPSSSLSAPSLPLAAVSLPFRGEDGIAGAPEGPESPGRDEELPDGRRFDAEPPDGAGIDGVDAVEPDEPGREGIDGPLGPDAPGIEGLLDDEDEDDDDGGLGIEGPDDDEDDEGDELGIDGMPLLELCCCVDSQPARIKASADAPIQRIASPDRLAARAGRPENCCVFMMASDVDGRHPELRSPPNCADRAVIL